VLDGFPFSIFSFHVFQYVFDCPKNIHVCSTHAHRITNKGTECVCVFPGF